MLEAPKTFPKVAIMHLPRLITLFLSFVAVATLAARPALEKPNVILIMADDVSWEAFG